MFSVFLGSIACYAGHWEAMREGDVLVHCQEALKAPNIEERGEKKETHREGEKGEREFLKGYRAKKTMTRREKKEKKEDKERERERD